MKGRKASEKKGVDSLSLNTTICVLIDMCVCSIYCMHSVCMYMLTVPTLYACMYAYSCAYTVYTVCTTYTVYAVHT